MDRHYKKGDLVLTHVDTKPEMYITLEVSRHDGDGSHETPILVNHSQTVVFDKGIYGPNLARHCGFALARYGVYRGNQVRKILAAVDSELKLGTPWLTPGRWTQGM
ncbi:hypothetical protein [Williamsia sterculiae]|uniref:Uncharacterized protein n=1 Tax=Williamsia sterculiae TaxID=1344003 RepID=A0A1N7GH94_9NOCA|nr:hypothetical protein [Williamsia sterculiae]SIS11912.1 hypothetical protein SAMN05445060_2781 [Williamsia sterculiae]